VLTIKVFYIDAAYFNDVGN